MGKSNCDPRGSRQWVIGDKTGLGMESCAPLGHRDRRLHSRPGRSIGARSKEDATGQRKSAWTGFSTLLEKAETVRYLGCLREAFRESQ